ncbi:hypothetical protein GGQ68_004259 [Sagittula marina]|uniref:Uncharacterized protein n=1 Tax=Sagittula marina TaxID=943940 RepID=A0A7W6GU83_9RHOB|nr:hypothetical protein [Sagittula marina]MBB3987905.1 hypothetical protein [Sagittula marina]
MPIGQRADEGLRQPQDQVLQGNRKPEGFSADVGIQLDRAEEQAERLSDAHGDGDEHCRADQDNPGASAQRGSIRGKCLAHGLSLRESLSSHAGLESIR